MQIQILYKSLGHLWILVYTRNPRTNLLWLICKFIIWLSLLVINPCHLKSVLNSTGSPFVLLLLQHFWWIIPLASSVVQLDVQREKESLSFLLISIFWLALWKEKDPISTHIKFVYMKKVIERNDWIVVKIKAAKRMRSIFKSSLGMMMTYLKITNGIIFMTINIIFREYKFELLSIFIFLS